MQIKKSFLLILMLSVIVNSLSINILFAANDENHSYSLKKCLTEALGKNKRLKSYNEKIYSSKASLSEANANLYLPNITFQSKLYYQDYRQGAGMSFSPEISYNISNSLSLNYVLFAFGAMKDQKDIAELSLKVSSINRKIEELKLQKQIKTAYHGILLAQEQLRVKEEIQKYQNENAKIAYKNYRRGQIAKFKYQAVRIQYENSKTDVTKSKSDLRSAINNVFLLMGKQPIPKNEDISDYFFDGTLKGSSSIEKEGEVEKSEDAELLGKAQKFRIELQQLYIQLDMLKLKKSAVSTGDKPNLAVFAALNRTDTTPYSQGINMRTLSSQNSDVGHWNKTYTGQIGLQLTIPLTDYLFPFLSTQTDSKVKAAEADIKDLEYNLEFLKDSIETEVTTNIIALQTAKQNIEVRKQVRDIANEAYQDAIANYRSGIIDYLNYRDAEVNYINAEFGMLAELYNYKVALINLFYSIGGEE